jgi:farnesyl diphosphate synthase
MAHKTTLQEFEAVFPTLVQDLLDHCDKFGLPQMAKDWFKAVCTFLISTETSC